MYRTSEPVTKAAKAPFGTIIKSVWIMQVSLLTSA